ncbi:Gfo/Idh/MocA family protein [Embleya sp. NPDC059237]|uniref:Gfo/Idh/MocA family protein n=1 Tax=Embleya sp. NPDC059237 TaxID=3346784 RepID=UPI0036AE41EC
MTTYPVRVGIIGCGVVAHEYARTLAPDPDVHVTACTDLDPARARDFGLRHNISPVPPENILDPAHVDLIAVLTPPDTHATLIRDAITAGLPAIWTEKPLAMRPGDAEALIIQAAEAGILLGAAPDTPMGSAAQTALRALEKGAIGEPLSASAALHNRGPERWHPNPQAFHTDGIGPLGDMGPYYLATLTHLLGHVTRVHGATTQLRNPRVDSTGAAFTARAATHVTALLGIGDIPITFTASFDTGPTRAPHLEIHGSDGVLVLPDPNFHDGAVLLRGPQEPAWTTLPAEPPVRAHSGRGMGVADLAHALSHGTTPFCDAARAAHVAHIIESIHTFASPGRVPGSSR